MKNREELKRMRAAGRVVSEVLMRLEEEAKEGVTTWELNEIAERMCATGGFKPAFKGYANYPASVCFALNEEIVHGIPSKKKMLKDGDIVGIDFGVLLDGYYADSAITVAVGEIRPVAEKLLRVTRDSLYRGIDVVKSSNRVLDISKEIQTYVENEGFSIVIDFVGHGIGRELHEEPQVP
ncbi:MAG: type I methionyl aminopeptidase, partial [Candidatus Dadabacteria bacterium]|nr:type I methionyl aminopeptidase [Candidatus Dadabacteria bacterium]